MTRAHVDVELACQLAVSLLLEKCRRALVHSWPDGVGTQAQQQLEQLLVGLRTDVAARPGTQAKVFVVDEDAAELHRWLLQRGEAVVHLQPLALLRHHVAPPYPRRHTRHSRELQDAVGRAAPFVAHHHEVSVVHPDVECILPCDDLLIGQLALLQLLELLVCELAQLDDLQPSSGIGFRALSGHRQHVLAEHVESNFHDGRIVRLCHIAHVRMAVEPHKRTCMQQRVARPDSQYDREQSFHSSCFVFSSCCGLFYRKEIIIIRIIVPSINILYERNYDNYSNFFPINPTRFGCWRLAEQMLLIRRCSPGRTGACPARFSRPTQWCGCRVAG